MNPTIKSDPHNEGDFICDVPADDRSPRVWIVFTGPDGIRANVGIRSTSEGISVTILNDANIDAEVVDVWATWGELDSREDT